MLLLSVSCSTLTPTQNTAHPEHSPIAPTADQAYPEINWSDLTSPSWNSTKVFSQFNFYKFKDGDPAAEVELKKMRSAFNQAPAQEKMNGKKISISGFMVPLTKSTDNISEFLLVAFVGTCIHEAPPAANQTIYVTTAQPLPDIKAMTAITIKGTLETVYTDTPMGGAAYRIENAQVDSHVTKRCLFAPTCDTEQ